MDVTTIGATIIYGFVSASALRVARKQDDDVERVTGIVGLVVMLFFGVCLLLPNVLFSHGLAAESYFLFTAWGILGFLAFRRILRKDDTGRLGRSMIVWIGLLSLVVFFSFTWMSQAVVATTNETIGTVQAHYEEQAPPAFAAGEGSFAEMEANDEQFVEEEMELMENNIERTIFIAAILFTFALALLLSNYSYMMNWARKSEKELDAVKDIALTDPLTGVKSRHAFRQQEQAMNAAIANGYAGSFAIVVCDLNDLKGINDTYGHEAGDDSIKAASSIVCETFAHSPVFRIGGDEFAVLLRDRDFDSRDELMGLFRQRAEANAGAGDVVVASGLANYRAGDDADMRSVIERADMRMYEDKRRLKDMTPARVQS